MVPAAFRRKVSPVTSSASLRRWPIVGILRYVPQRTWVSAQSSPTYHIFVFPCLAQLLGVSGPSITGARAQRPSNHRLAEGVLPREERSFLTGQAVWRRKSFPGSAYRAGRPLLTLGREGLGK
jgi:hypothetical protein